LSTNHLEDIKVDLSSVKSRLYCAPFIFEIKFDGQNLTYGTNTKFDFIPYRF